MHKLLRADLYRLYHNKKIWIALLAMLSVAGMMVTMQYTAMDYKVPLSRVIFLPMTFFGLILAALIGFFVGEDFSEGTVRNKIIAGNCRMCIYMSQIICVWSAALILYAITIGLTFCVGLSLFTHDVGTQEIAVCFGLGCLTVIAMGSLFYLLSICIGNRSVAVTVCMGLAFLMLFLCLHTNQILTQQEFKDGVINIYYVSGIKRLCYELLHDINPMGQIAQLSEMKCISVMRWIAVDVVWVLISLGAGMFIFEGKDIR